MNATDRAQTYIDRNRGYVGNRWIGRSWSLFTGETLGLHNIVALRDWLAASSALPCPVIGVDAISVGPPTIEWAEEYSPHGAILVARWTVDQVAVTTRTSALHDHPALIQTIEVRLGTGTGTGATGTAQVHLASWDSLTLGAPNLSWSDYRLVVAGEDHEWRPDPECCVVSGGPHRLIFGSGRGARVKAQDNVYTWHLTESLPAGRCLKWPATFIYAFQGDLNARVESGLAEFVIAMRQFLRQEDPVDDE